MSEVLEKALLRSVAQSFDNYFKDSMVGAPEEVMLWRAKTLASARDSLQWLRFYPVSADASANGVTVYFHRTEYSDAFQEQYGFEYEKAYGIGAAGDLDPDPPELVGFEAGMDETGLLYGYTLTGPDGNDLYGTFSLLPRYGTLRTGIVGGENLFETTGYLEFEEVSG